MRFLALALLSLTVASTAAAKSGRRAAVHSSARVLACDGQARSATFQGRMETFGRAVGLSMRFGLQTRGLTAVDWSRVAAPTFDVWVAAAAGAPRYVYDKAVENLPEGAEYRAVVRFRWRNAKGRVVARQIQRTRACRQPDSRPDLEPLRLTVAEGSREETRYYTLRVVNAGQSAAAPFAARLDVAGTAGPDQVTGEPLAPGEEESFDFEGPRCVAGEQITATLDPNETVPESDETDNVLVVQCPVGAS